MAANLSIEWSFRAISDLDRLYTNLLEIWTPKEANIFLDLVQEFEFLVCRYPEAFSTSVKKKNCRLALIHKNVSAVYLIKKTKSSC